MKRLFFIREVLVNKDRQDALTEKVDRALTHRVWGIPIFLGIMAVVLFLTFTIDVYKRQVQREWTE